tara:strand:- start:588 stop:1376 length:789 start_codon:yes stop_codon:yes gene_type:complete
MSSVDEFYKNLPQYKIELEDLLNVKKPRRGRPRRKSLYFTPITEHAIIAYNSESSQAKRDRVYREWIHYPLLKLAENIINTFKFPYIDGTIEDIKHDVVCFILSKLDKFSADKGKAFSYFSIVAKNYLIQKNTKEYKFKKLKVGLDSLDYNWSDDYIDDSNVYSDLEEPFEVKQQEFLDGFVLDYRNKVDSVFETTRDINIAYSILDVFQSRVSVEIFNKKALYIMIREITDAKTEHITRVINVIKKDFNREYSDFLQKNQY